MATSTEDIALLDRVREMPDGDPILSIYVALEPSRNVEHAHVPELTRIVRSQRERLTDDERSGFEDEAERCLDYMRNEFEPKGRTLLIFSSLPRNLWLTLQIQPELPSQAHFGSHPYLLPLLAEPTLERRAIVMIDSANARILTTRLGSLESEQDVKDYVPRGTRQRGRKHQQTGASGGERAGGTPSFREDQSLDEWVAEHYRKVRDALHDLHETNPFERLAIAGTSENTARLIEMLPEPFAAILSGTFPAEPYLPADRVLESAEEVFRRKRSAEDRESIAKAFDLARSGGTGTLGWEDTLSALQQGSVMRLLLAQDARQSGERCQDGHYVGVQAQTCPVCGKQLREVTDLSDFAAHLAVKSDAAISYVEAPVSEALAEAGGIAALLRY
jgi:peptide chain release factor subunit 1